MFFEILKISFNEILSQEFFFSSFKVISAILVPKTLVKLENKLNFTKFINGKSYYPTTYIYNKNAEPRENQLIFSDKRMRNSGQIT